MRIILNTGFILLAFLMHGCAMKQAQTAQEFRMMAPQSSYGAHDTLTVTKPYSSAVANFKKKADKCLTTELVLTYQNQYGQTISTQNLSYTPTLVVGKSKTTLSVQKNVSGDGMIAGKVPEKGMFLVVADLTPVAKNKTRLDIYRNTYETDIIVAAIKNWATGKSLACPDWPE